MAFGYVLSWFSNVFGMLVATLSIVYGKGHEVVSSICDFLDYYPYRNLHPWQWVMSILGHESSSTWHLLEFNCLGFFAISCIRR